MTNSPHVRTKRPLRSGLLALTGAATLVTALLSTVMPAPAVADDACGATTYKGDGSPWVCTFVDEFTGTAVNTTRWTKVSSSTTRFTQGAACLTPNNVSVSGGTVKLKVTKALLASSCYLGAGWTTKYKGAGLVTGPKFQQAYGAFEVRAKYPLAREQGLWGGWWMTPEDKTTYGDWPAYGEIDAAEWWSGVANHVYPSLHYTGRVPASDTGWNCTVTDASAWHTYRLEWAPRLMKSFIDGQLCWERAWDASAYDHPEAPFDTTRGINLVMGLDANTPDPSGITFPQVYEVDYVKVWE